MCVCVVISYTLYSMVRVQQVVVHRPDIMWMGCQSSLLWLPLGGQILFFLPCPHSRVRIWSCEIGSAVPPRVSITVYRRMNRSRSQIDRLTGNTANHNPTPCAKLELLRSNAEKKNHRVTTKGTKNDFSASSDLLLHSQVATSHNQ